MSQPGRAPSTLSKIAREPLVAFFFLGAALFALDRARPRGAEVARRDGPIVLDAAVQKGVTDTFFAAEGRAPTEPERLRALDAYVEEEVLFREGLRLGLDRDDPKVRQRVAAKTLAVLGASIVLTEPTDAELRAHHAAHGERWDRPALLELVQVFVSGNDGAARARAELLLAELERGVDPAGLGDPFAGGRRYRQRSLADLAERFGPAFASGLDSAPIGRWLLRESRHGLHLLRVERRTAGETPPFEAVRADVAADLFERRRDAALRARVSELRARAVVTP